MVFEKYAVGVTLLTMETKVWEYLNTKRARYVSIGPNFGH